MAMARVKKAKPTSDQTFQAFAYITLANMPLAKTRHMARNKFKHREIHVNHRWDLAVGLENIC